MKGLRNLLLATVVALGLTALPAFAYGPFYADGVTTYEHGAPLTVHVDGSYVATDVQPEIVNGRTFLPMRAVAEAMDASVSWDGNKKLISVFKNGTEAYFYVGWQTYYVNGQAKTASVAPYIKDGRTMLPIRDFAQALGSQVNWDGRNASVDIYTGGPVAAAPQIPSDVPSDMRWLVEKYYVAPTEQGVGTWYGELHWNFPVDGSEKTYNYFFISKMANGQKNAVVFTYSADTGYGPVVYMQTGSIGETAYGFDLTEVEDWKKYFYGGAMDFYGYTIWHMNYSGNDLLHTGSTRCFIDSYFTPFNDLYKRIG